MNGVFPLMILIGILSIIATVALALLVKKNRLFKYLPALIIVFLAMAVCIVITIMNYSKYGRAGYIGIVYIVVLIITSPSVILSIVIAACFDIHKMIRNKHFLTIK